MPDCFSGLSVKFQGHTGQKNRRFWPGLSVSGLWLEFQFADGFQMMHKAWSIIEEVPYCFSRSSCKFQVTRDQKKSILTQIGGFRTVTPVRIHWWLWNDAQSLKQYRRGALLFFRVICQISRSHGTKKSPILTRIERFRTVTWVSLCRLLSNDAQSSKQYRRGSLLFFKIILQISRSHETKKPIDFDPNWRFPDCNSS